MLTKLLTAVAKNPNSSILSFCVTSYPVVSPIEVRSVWIGGKPGDFVDEQVTGIIDALNARDSCDNTSEDSLIPKISSREYKERDLDSVHECKRWSAINRKVFGIYHLYLRHLLNAQRQLRSHTDLVHDMLFCGLLDSLPNSTLFRKFGTKSSLFCLKIENIPQDRPVRNAHKVSWKQHQWLQSILSQPCEYSYDPVIAFHYCRCLGYFSGVRLLSNSMASVLGNTSRHMPRGLYALTSCFASTETCDFVESKKIEHIDDQNNGEMQFWTHVALDAIDLDDFEWLEELSERVGSHIDWVCAFLYTAHCEEQFSEHGTRPFGSEIKSDQSNQGFTQADQTESNSQGDFQETSNVIFDDLSSVDQNPSLARVEMSRESKNVKCSAETVIRLAIDISNEPKQLISALLCLPEHVLERILVNGAALDLIIGLAERSR